MMIRKGTKVKLKKGVTHSCPDGRDDNDTVVVQSTHDSWAKGAVYLNRDLHGCRWWNKKELVRA
ncbi:MAG: hypothetical protein JSV32_04955 [Dehalococcoidia bacterium]|nr:MAG: hypothetical protein JSV32_04955 [Dehalococcoidia bacterium]